MQTASDIIEKLGGVANLARNAGIPLTTVMGWKQANFIPEWRQPALISLGKKRKVTLRDTDFPPKAARIKCKDRFFVATRKVTIKGYAQSDKAKAVGA